MTQCFQVIEKTTGQGFRESAYLPYRRQWIYQAPMPERPVVCSRLSCREFAVSNALQYHIERLFDVTRYWQQQGRRTRVSRLYSSLHNNNQSPQNNNQSPQNDNHEGGSRCPACNARAPIAPGQSQYRGRGRIDHHWICDTCGHAWITSLRVLS